MNNFTQVKIEIFVPETYIETLRDELAKVGAGRVGNYDHCLAFSQVKGYWRPLDGSEPFAGEIGKISSGSECKVEMNCARELVAEALSVIRKTHPYDEPLVNIVPLANHLFLQV